MFLCECTSWWLMQSVDQNNTWQMTFLWPWMWLPVCLCLLGEYPGHAYAVGTAAVKGRIKSVIQYEYEKPILKTFFCSSFYAKAEGQRIVMTSEVRVSETNGSHSVALWCHGVTNVLCVFVCLCVSGRCTAWVRDKCEHATLTVSITVGLMWGDSRVRTQEQ